MTNFPAFSQTFIRDQIVSLLDQGVNVTIYTKNGRVNTDELGALCGFESYSLLDRVIDIDILFEKNWLKRCFSATLIFFKAIFCKNIKFYFDSLRFNKYGSISKSLRLFFRLHYIVENNIDIIHAHFGPNGIEAAMIKQLGYPIKLFVTFHGYDIRLGINNGGEMYKKLFEKADGIISISEFNYQNLINFGVKKEKLISLSNGINVSFFKRKSRIVTSENLKILTVARLVEEKSLFIAIRSLSKLLLEKPDIKFEYIIVGEGNKRKELQNLIELLDLTEYVKLVGAKSSIEVRDLMVRSDMFLLSSQAEALPTVLLEAQASRMIVLATNVGAVADIVKGGLVVHSNDIESFKNALIELIEKRADWDSITNEGRKFVCSHHNLILQTKKLIKYYKN